MKSQFSFAQNASLMRIGDGMLQNASSLSKIKLPGRLRSIPGIIHSVMP